MTKEEALDLALDLALEALDKSLPRLAPYGEQDWLDSRAAITAIKQALAAPVQDSTCNETLRAQGKAYPRTCRKCGLGPCIGAPKQPPAAQRQWVGLTDEEWETTHWSPDFRAGAKWAAAKLRSKNNG